MNFEWFAGHVSRLSRQVLTTMGKRAGVKPYRAKGEWRFRTTHGADRTLEQVYAALKQNPGGRQWLKDEYEYPMRAAEATRESQARHEQELRDQLLAVFDFLPREYGYSAAFDLPVRIKDRLILAFRNPRAARQVEISGDPFGYLAHCEIRRLIDDEPGAYGADSIADWELRMMQREGGDDAILLERDRIVRRIAQTLGGRADILRGEAWIDREDIDRTWSRNFSRKFGFPPAPRGTPDRLDTARERAEFLVRQYDFVLEFDSSTLSPHESEMWRTLRYRRGDSVVEIANTDIRIPGEWSVRVNGTTLISGDVADWDHAITAALAEVKRRIS